MKLFMAIVQRMTVTGPFEPFQNDNEIGVCVVAFHAHCT